MSDILYTGSTGVTMHDSFSQMCVRKAIDSCFNPADTSVVGLAEPVVVPFCSATFFVEDGSRIPLLLIQSAGTPNHTIWIPPVNIQKAIENGHRNSGFSH